MKNKIIERNELNIILENCRKSNKKIVFTNGCFDIIHRGHIEYLQKASELGDLLFLGLNSDLSVKRLKGNDRPINSEMDRAIVLSALECINYVCIFDEDTPLKLIKLIKPDILVKGGDYKIDDVVGAEYAKKTTLIDFLYGYSTTNIIKKINN